MCRKYKMTKKAVALVSGGLDSLLAAKVIQNQGIHVEGLMFQIGFAKSDFAQPTRKKEKNDRKSAEYYAEKAGIKLHVIDIFEDFKQVLIAPKRGYGGHLNPCIDCKSFMIRKAKEWMEENGFDFIISGEVIGQRPMSQRRDTLPLIAKESGAKDLILRPLCAKLMPPTRAEIEGWIDREKMYDINGRGRKPQMALAKELGIDEYPQPAGGCLLTEADTTNKMLDLWESRGEKDYTKDDIMLFAGGRHVRPKKEYKLIIARENGETQYLKQFRSGFVSIVITSHPGPIAIVDGEMNGDDEKIAAAIVARFGKGRDGEVVTAQIMWPGGVTKELKDIKPIAVDDVNDDWYV